MRREDFQLTTPLSAIIFDCDGTLSHIEGIDELAKAQGVSEEVTNLTEEAMGQTGLNLELYERRLQLVSPTEAQVQALAGQYFQRKAPDLLATLDVFRSLQKKIYIISAGLAPAVFEFGNLLGVDTADIFAVDIYFNAHGEYEGFDSHSPLVHNDGKQRIVQQLKKEWPSLALIGDGLNDLAASRLVSRFIGYGGAYCRDTIAKQCEYYLKTPSMSALLPLCLTATETAQLKEQEMKLYQQGLRLLAKNKIFKEKYQENY